jgi:hypothetical protein
MTSIIEKDNLILSIPKNLLNEKLVQKLIRLIEFSALTKDNIVSEKQAFQLSEELKTIWWEKNKDWFLKDIEQ